MTSEIEQLDNVVDQSYENSSQEIYRLLRQLRHIEDSFRVMKSSLKPRPVSVWTDPHTRGHFVLNYLALVMPQLMPKKLKDQGIQLK